MQYKLYNENEREEDELIIRRILKNRGIGDVERYLNLTSDVVIDYNNLCNIEEAVKKFKQHFDSLNPISILVDPDVDGYTSGSVMYQYIKRLNEDYPVQYVMHKKEKCHGLDDDSLEYQDGMKLLIIPDAGTNDVEKCNELIEKGIDIIILDHHEMEETESPNKAIIVNNQTSQYYINKALSGVGIVYKFCQALDGLFWVEYADDFLDLVALGNISDVMDMRSEETRYLVNKGLNNINNKALSALIEKQQYSMNGVVNIHNIQWYVTPILNGMIRVGSYEEKELLFRALIEDFEEFEYKTRATKIKPSQVIMEDIYTRSARLCGNAKSRQDKIRDKAVKQIVELIDGSDIMEDKVIIVDVTEILENKGMTGVVAIRVAEQYNRPCLLLKVFTEELENVPTKCLSGSARNQNGSPIDSLKDVCEQNKYLVYARGHGNAFGCSIKLEDLTKAKKEFNKLLKNIIYDSTYYVDYIIEYDDFDSTICYECDKLADIYGQGISECLIALKHVKITKNDISLLGKTGNTLSIENEDGLKLVQFFIKEDNPILQWYNNSWNEDDYVVVDIVGEPSVNDYNCVRTPQIVIKDVEIIEGNTDDMYDDSWD